MIEYLQDATDLVASRMTMVTAFRRFCRVDILELTAGHEQTWLELLRGHLLLPHPNIHSMQYREQKSA